MSKFDPEAFEASVSPPPIPSTGWSDLPMHLKGMAIAVIGLETLCVFAWAASFSTINPMGDGIFLVDLLPFPLPDFLKDLSVGGLLNGVLGLIAVATPTAIWHFILRDRILSNITEYFRDDILRIAVGGILLCTYLATVALEILSLLKRIDASLNTGPLDLLESQPELLPLALVSAALILGSCLLGLASAALFHSLQNRHLD